VFVPSTFRSSELPEQDGRESQTGSRIAALNAKRWVRTEWRRFVIPSL
jgi:hypothetical protein